MEDFPPMQDHRETFSAEDIIFEANLREFASR
jgi:hypothetical protein